MTNLSLTDVVFLGEDSESVEVVLAVEEHIEARLLDVAQGKRKSTLTEDGGLL